MPSDSQTFGSVWDAISGSPGEAQAMRMRSNLITTIVHRVNTRGMTQAAAAERAGVTAPRMSDLFNGKISKFSLEALIEIATALDLKVEMTVNAA